MESVPTNELIMNHDSLYSMATGWFTNENFGCNRTVLLTFGIATASVACMVYYNYHCQNENMDKIAIGDANLNRSESKENNNGYHSYSYSYSLSQLDCQDVSHKLFIRRRTLLIDYETLPSSILSFSRQSISETSNHNNTDPSSSINDHNEEIFHLPSANFTRRLSQIENFKRNKLAMNRVGETSQVTQIMQADMPTDDIDDYDSDGSDLFYKDNDDDDDDDDGSSTEPVPTSKIKSLCVSSNLLKLDLKVFNHNQIENDEKNCDRAKLAIATFTKSLSKFDEYFDGEWPPRTQYCDWPDEYLIYLKLCDEMPDKLNKLNNIRLFREWVYNELKNNISISEWNRIKKRVINDCEKSIKTNKHDPILFSLLGCLMKLLLSYRWAIVPLNLENLLQHRQVKYTMPFPK